MSVDTPRPPSSRTSDSAGESRHTHSARPRSAKRTVSPLSGSESDELERTLRESASSSRHHKCTPSPAGERSRPSGSRHTSRRAKSPDSEDSEDERHHTTSSRSRASSVSTSDANGRKSSIQSPGSEAPVTRRQRAVRFAGSVTEEHSSDSENDTYLPASQNRRTLKPPTFNGSENFETFYARFENCAKYNGWSREEQLAHLRNSLTNEAGQVLWDSGPEITNSLRRLTTLLKARFGGAAQSDKYKMELRSRTRQPRESLSNLYSDIKRLMVLGYPDLDPKAREVIAVDRFIDSLNDADLALKIRKRTPTTLD